MITQEKKNNFTYSVKVVYFVVISMNTQQKQNISILQQRYTMHYSYGVVENAMIA